MLPRPGSVRPGDHEEILTCSIGAHRLEMTQITVGRRFKLLVCTRRLHRYARDEEEALGKLGLVSLLGEVVDPREGVVLAGRAGLLMQGGINN